ncbi:chymotrypsin-1-like [Octopus vulgaris]|uniref:Chymotrypsin-1-like n=1 Tax=Octopus vulgaris TaxID=6645 RepID=A0AA36BVY3_OCTVU|nr:chymotrypsin-1-like [Octopus vulgaris]
MSPMTGDIKKVKVSIGSNLRSRKSNSRSVSNILKRSEYTNILGDPEDYLVKNDIAILTLNQSVSEGNCVRFASLANQGETFGTSRCIAAGWGRLAPDGNIPDALYKVPLPIVPHDECKKNSIMQISEGVLCAGDFVLGGASTCHGDSGGPLYCPNSNGEMVLAGVNSFGYECDEDINAFTDVGYFRNWIQTHL